MEYAFGLQGYYLVAVAMFTFAYGALLAYMVIIGDTFSSVFRAALGPGGAGSIWVAREFWIVMVSLCCILPLSLLRSMASLG